jgi:hypothetical protein
LLTIPGSTSNLSVDEQQAAAATIVHREQEALIAAVATPCKTLDEAWARERAADAAWEKEKTIAHHVE